MLLSLAGWAADPHLVILRALAATAVLLAVPSLALPAQASTAAQVIATIPVGATPFGIGVTPDGSRVYVSNSTGASVSVIDTAAATVTSTITSDVGTTPVGIAIDRSGMYAYVANYGGSGTFRAGTVTRISVADGSTTSIDLPSIAATFCYYVLNITLSPDGSTLYAACQDEHRVISAPVTGGAGSGSVLMIRNLTFPTDVALSSSGSTLVSSLSNTNQAFILDGSGSSFVGVTAGPYAVAVSPTTGLAYLAGQTSGALSVVDTAARAIVGSAITVGGSLSDIAITPDGANALVSVVDQDVVRIVSLGTGQITQSIAVGDGPQSLTISSDGRYAYTANRYDNTVSVIALPENPASGESVPTAPIQQFARTESDACDAQPTSLADFPALSDHGDRGWGPSWAQWPNGGTGGFVCTRQPFYTSRGTWSVA